MSSPKRVRNTITNRVGNIVGTDAHVMQGRCAVMYDGEHTITYTLSVFLEEIQSE